MDKRELTIDELFEFNKQSHSDKRVAEEATTYRTLEERLKLCQQCNLRAFSAESGLVCSLSDKKPDFTLSCEHFQTDENLKLKSMETTSGRYTGFWVSRKPALILSILSFIKAFVRAISNQVDYLALFFLLVGIIWFFLSYSEKELKK